jgi:hypothetical protein
MTSASAVKREDWLRVEAVVRHVADETASITTFKHHSSSHSGHGLVPIWSMYRCRTQIIDIMLALPAVARERVALFARA